MPIRQSPAARLLRNAFPVPGGMVRGAGISPLFHLPGGWSDSVATRGPVPALRRGERSSQSDLLLLLANASAYGVCGFELLRTPLGRFPGAFPLLLAAAFALGARAMRSQAPRNEPLFLCTAGFPLLCVTLHLPAQAGTSGVA